MTSQLQNSANRYGAVAIAFHWLMGLLLTALVVLGLYMTALPDVGFNTWKIRLVLYHKELGIIAFEVQELPQGGWRFVCDVRTTQTGCLRRIETGPAATEAEAISLALVEAGRPAANDR